MVELTLPGDLLNESVALHHAPAANVQIRVPADYQARWIAMGAESEVLAIQRLISITGHQSTIHVFWDAAIAERAQASPAIFPLLAVLLLIDGAVHALSETGELLDVAPARHGIFQYRVKADLFAESQIIVCADSQGHGRPRDLYSPQTRALRSKLDFETLVVDVLSRLLSADQQFTAPYRNSSAVGVVAAELFENTDMHGRLDETGIPLRSNGLRGLIFKRVRVPRKPGKPHEGPATAPFIDCLEISVFDSGLGYYPTYTKRPLTAATPLEEEWKVLHNCLQRHYFHGIPDVRPEHRAMGLYEVLRAVESVNGQFEVRTGRLHAYRTFLPGELRPGMEPPGSDRPGRPMPKLLDVDRKFAAAPSLHEVVVGASVRVIVPLD